MTTLLKLSCLVPLIFYYHYYFFFLYEEATHLVNIDCPLDMDEGKFIRIVGRQKVWEGRRSSDLTPTSKRFMFHLLQAVNFDLF